MKTTNDIDSRIDKALQTIPKIEFSDDFSEAVIRKIEVAEAKSLRSQWIAYGLSIAIFSLASIIVLVIFMKDLPTDMLLKASSWVLLIVGLLSIFQIIENKYLRRKSLN